MSMCVVEDKGYWQDKVYRKGGMFKEKYITFRSKVEKSDGLIKKENTYTLEYEGELFEIGDGVDETNININLDKTTDRFYKLITLTALGLITDEEIQEFKLVSNLPLNYFTKENKAKMEEYLKTDYIQFKLNNKKKTIKIEDVTIFPQTLPAIYSNNIKTDIVGVLDIGGLTVQGLIAKDKNMVGSTKFSDKLGILIYQDKVKRELDRVFNCNIKDYEIENIIRHGLPSNITKSKEVIAEVSNEHVKEIVVILEKVGWNLDNIEILLTGGGSLVLEEFLVKYLSNTTMSSNPVFDNVKGLWEVARVIYDA